MVQLRKGEGCESVAVRRHGCARKWAFRRGGNRLVVGTLHQKSFVVLSSLQELGGSNVLLLSSMLETVDAATVLLLNIRTLLSQSMALLLPTLLGREPFLVSGDQAIVLLIQSCLTLLKAFTFLKCVCNVGLHALDLGFNVGLDCIKFTSHSVLVVTFFLPFRLLCCSFFGLFFWNCTQIFGLQREFSSSVVCLSDVLRKLKDTLALTLIAAPSVRQAIAKGVDLFLDRRDGSFVVFLITLQTVALLL